MKAKYGFVSGLYGKKMADVYVNPGYTPIDDEIPTLQRIMQRTEAGEIDSPRYFIGYDNPLDAQIAHVSHVGYSSAPCEDCDWSEIDPDYEPEDDDEGDVLETYYTIPASRLADLGIMPGSPIFQAITGDEEIEDDEDDDEGLNLDEALSR
jgi:hypothetical protein